MKRVKINDEYYGDGRRLEFQENELRNAPIVPNPVEYDDIDKAVFDFFRDNITVIDDNGEKVPTFRLFSNQRFTEYSQTWQHTDKDGNLLMNFKTVSRENNPQFGNLHGGRYNIPGNNRFTVCMRDTVDDNGVESYEITSMSQPVMADLQYSIGFICSKMDKLNSFNQQLNQMFQSRQCYVCVNGHYMPMVMDSIGDDSRYNIDERKFFSQTASVKLMAYIIPKDDIKVELKPKRVSAKFSIDKMQKTYVDMDFDTDSDTRFRLNIKYRNGVTSARFVAEDSMSLVLGDRVNVNNVKVYVNDDEYDTKSKIIINAGDNMSVYIVPPNKTMPSSIVFAGEIL